MIAIGLQVRSLTESDIFDSSTYLVSKNQAPTAVWHSNSAQSEASAS